MENKKHHVENEENLECRKTSCDKIILAIVALFATFTLLGQFIGQLDGSGAISGFLKVLGNLPFIGVNNGGGFELVAVILTSTLVYKIYKNHSFNTILMALVLLFLVHLYMNGVILGYDMTFFKSNTVFHR